MRRASATAIRGLHNDLAEEDDSAVVSDVDGPHDELEAERIDTVPTPDGEPPSAPVASARRRPPHRIALLLGAAMVTALGAVGGWLGVQSNHYHQIDSGRAAFLQAARQGAVNLTTIDWQHADADVQRILDTATGSFYDDFSKRSGPFIDVVKQSQSTSTGTVLSSGVQSASADTAQVLVAVKVNITNAVAPQQPPRSWRMQLTVKKMGDAVKVSDVEFVP